MNIIGSSQLLYTTVRIVGTNGQQSSIGTGFFFRFLLDGEQSIPVLVTNKHVVRGMSQGTFLVHLADQDRNPLEQSETIQIEEFTSAWVDHPTADLCAMPFEPIAQAARAEGKELYTIFLPEDLLMSDQALHELSALEEIVMVGYPNGLWDNTNNFPLLRRGITSSHPAVNFQGRSEGVIDIASVPGSSGSPVLLYNQSSYTNPDGGITLGSRVKLLGVLWGGPQMQRDGTIGIVDIPTVQTPVAQTMIPIHLGYYIKAKELLEIKKILLKGLQ